MRVLIVRVGAMGDVLHALPAVAGLKRQRPDVQVDWVIDERWRALVTDEDAPGPLVTRSYPVPTRAWKAAPFSLATLKSLRSFRKLAGEYDAVVDIQGTMRSAMLGALAARGRQLAGYSDPRETLAARLYARRLPRVGAHVVEQGAALLGEALGTTVTPHVFALPLTEWAENWAEQEAVLRRPLALLAPGGGWGAKRWPLERFGDVAKGLGERGYDVVVTAARKSSPDAGAVVSASGGAARVVVCNVAGLVALMRRVDLCVGGDTGPMHLAASLAVPTVALFGPTDPERNGPWGPGAKVVLRDAGSVTSYKRRGEVDTGLVRISVDQVLRTVDGLSG